MKFKRVVLTGDAHCGHRVGLTFPKYQSALPGEQYRKIQIELWDAYETWIKKLQPIDIFVHNGDAIDGKGTRSGGTELITTDTNKQIDMAYDAFSIAEAKKYVFTYGTPYHTGQDVDCEKVLADRFNAPIMSQVWLDVNGTTFDIKHKVAGSSIPHGKFTPPAKERLWNYIWSEFDEQPKADFIIRSHVHYYAICGEDHWTAFILPALQGQGSKYGARQCSNIVTFGLMYFDCYENGDVKWAKKTLRAVSQKQEPLVL